MTSKELTSIRDLSHAVDYTEIETKPVNKATLHFFNFVNMLNAENAMDNKTPAFHYQLIDNFLKHKYSMGIVHRGGAKSTLFSELVPYYITAFGGLPVRGMQDIRCIAYATDTKENGGKSFRNAMEFRWNNSKILQELIPITKFTDDRIYFENANGHKCTIIIYGATSSVRGMKENGKRIQLVILDDLLSDKNADHPTVIQDIGDLVYNKLIPGMDPMGSKITWIGTPFSDADPLSAAAIVPKWHAVAYPICQEFPCEKEEYIGSWPDRFSYETVKDTYEMMLLNGRSSAFFQEYMLDTIDVSNRLIPPEYLHNFNLQQALYSNMKYTHYILTDFAYTEKGSADYTAFSVWRYTPEGEFLWMEGFHERVSLDKAFDRLFALCDKWKIYGIGLELNGQQRATLEYLKAEMNRRKKWYTILGMPGKTNEGFIFSTSKLARIQSVISLFAAGKIKFPIEEQGKTNKALAALIYQLESVTYTGIKSKHDDMIDTVSPISLLLPFVKEKYKLEEVELDEVKSPMRKLIEEFQGRNKKRTSSGGINNYLA